MYLSPWQWQALYGKARQIVRILDDEQDTNYDLDHDPPCPESTLPTPDVVCLPCRDPSISLYGCLSWSPWCTCHHWQRSNWKYDPSLTRNTLDVQLYQVLSPSSSQMALLSFRWSKRYEEPSPLTSQTLHSRDLLKRILMSKCLPGPLLRRQTTLPCGPPRERCYLAMALSTHTGPRPHPVPSQPFAEPLYSVLLTLPKTVWPWEFLEVQLPDDAPPDSEYALEPRTDAPTLRNLKPSQLWPQSSVVSSVVRGIRIPNLSTEHLTLKHHEHFCQVTPVFEPKEEPPTSPSPTQRLLPRSHASLFVSVHVDPDSILPEAVRANFQSGSAGSYEAKVNMGPVEPPQQKGRLPQ